MLFASHWRRRSSATGHCQCAEKESRLLKVCLLYGYHNTPLLPRCIKASGVMQRIVAEVISILELLFKEHTYAARLAFWWRDIASKCSLSFRRHSSHFGENEERLDIIDSGEGLGVGGCGWAAATYSPNRPQYPPSHGAHLTPPPFRGDPILPNNLFTTVSSGESTRWTKATHYGDRFTVIPFSVLPLQKDFVAEKATAEKTKLLQWESKHVTFSLVTLSLHTFMYPE